MTLSSDELEMAQTVLRLLQSVKYKDRNYLFLEPFDVNDVPGYLDVCQKVMDLRTVSQNVERGVYTSLAQVWDDTKLIFENAVAYHSGRPQTKWIAKLAKDMLKAFAKERKALEKGIAAASASTATPVPSNVPSATPVAAAAAAAAVPEKKKISLKLKLPTAKDKAHMPVKAKPTQTKPVQPKLKLKLSLKSKASSAATTTDDATSLSSSAAPPSSGAATPLASSSSVPPFAPPLAVMSAPLPVIPKSSPKTAVAAAAAVVVKKSKKKNTAAAAAAAASTAGSSSTKPKLTLKIASRGKELPKGVTADTPVASTSSPSTSNAGAQSSSSAAPTTVKSKAGKTAKGGGKTSKGGTSKAAKAAAVKAASAAEASSSTTTASITAAAVVPVKATTGKGGKGGGKTKVPKAAKAKAAADGTNNKVGSAKSAGASKTDGATAATTTSKAPASSAKATKKSKKALAAAASAAASATSLSKGSSTFPMAQATKVVLGLRRRQQKNIAWFSQPVNDKGIVADYRAKIKNPMDISTLTAKLESGNYAAVPSFVLDVRRIIANCLKFNTSLKDSLRPVAVEVLQTAEELMEVHFSNCQPYPRLLYCWKLCVGVLDTLYNLVNPSDGQPTALYFLHPVSYYCGGQFPHDYMEKCPKPMDFGSVTANLLEAKYNTVEEFGQDCQLVLDNCLTYYGGREDGKVYIEQANRLKEVLDQQVEQLRRYVKSSRGIADQAQAKAPVVLQQPPIQLLLSILDDLRSTQYTDKATKITEAAMGPFEKPVSPSAFPDYADFVKEPMDLQSVERKVKANIYKTPEDFEYDVNLCFKNCEVYNACRSDHLVAMAKFASRKFRTLFYAKMRVLEDPSCVPLPSPSAPSSDKGDSSSTSPNKKIKIESSGVSKGKSAPRISITAAQVTSAAVQAASAIAVPSSTTASQTARAKSPGPSNKNKIISGGAVPTLTTSSSSQLPPKTNQPVPLHIAIARVKEAFPLRRAHKSLQPWEADCARYFKELMRHPWISAARPKFIFHVPVPTLFPELRDVYKAKIKTPMDLTTVECTLLAGNRYAGPEDFIADIALVFANAVLFNKDGRDIGDPLSCAYYDASVHLLRYSRWLSLEQLLQYAHNSDEIDEDGPDGLPPFVWKLTQGNKKRAREEMEKLVLNEPIEKSLEGDRWTWHEAECEKLLKALRHQSDLRYMTFFIQPNYPPDYAAFISKPMDWEKVQRTLKKRQYDKFGDVIEDLRLIFSNALKYNARLKGTDTVSGRAYDSAKYMSAKLEAAINKLMLSVGDRLERERIDHANAEREIEAAERAEEAQIRAAWKKEPDSKDGVSGGTTAKPDAAQKIRLVRRATQRRETTDFEIPFFDEDDDGQHERSYFEVVKSQKAMFERQRVELSKMRQCAAAIGTQVHSRMFQRSSAAQWIEQELLKSADVVDDTGGVKQSGEQLIVKKESESQAPVASIVLGALESGHVKIKLAVMKPQRKGVKRKTPAISLE